MNTSRRNLLLSTLFGAGCVGLRALATGIPASILLNPRRALAGPCTPATNPQFVIFQTSGNGDPINANAPGSYDPRGLQLPGGDAPHRDGHARQAELPGRCAGGPRCRAIAPASGT